jgi:hypothetical protein
MKGTILTCMKELVESRHGASTWQQVCAHAKVSPTRPVMPFSEIPDEDIFAVVGGICAALGVTQVQALDAFADYWCCVYAPRLYKTYFEGKKNTREFVLGINEMHARVTKQMKASPPHFVLEWKDQRTLVMTYQSKRPLIDLAAGMLRATGRYYGEDVQVKKLDDTHLQVAFPS